MPTYYSFISDKLNLDMKDLDFYYEADTGITPPDFYYEGMDQSCERNPLYTWNTHSVCVHKDNHIINYCEDVFLDLLLENEDGSTSWFDGRAANIIDIDESKVVEVRPANQYYIEDYDLEKSVKRRYKVALEETSEMSEFDYKNFTNTILSK